VNKNAVSSARRKNGTRKYFSLFFLIIKTLAISHRELLNNSALCDDCFLWSIHSMEIK
jgi:hypothetical protein